MVEGQSMDSGLKSVQFPPYCLSAEKEGWVISSEASSILDNIKTRRASTMYCLLLILSGVSMTFASSVYPRGAELHANHFSLNCTIQTMTPCQPVLDDCSVKGCFQTGLINRKDGCCQLVCICSPEVHECAASSQHCEECPSHCNSEGDSWWHEERQCCVKPCHCPIDKCKNEMEDTLCDRHVEAGHCESNASYMKVYCTKSCNACNIWNEGNCENKLADNLLCRRYFVAGYCKPNSWTRKHCAEACNSCDEA